MNTAAMLLAGCMCALSLLPTSGAVLCIGADGHVAVELPHAAGRHTGESARECEGSSHNVHRVAPPCRDLAEDCSDHALDRQCVPQVRRASSGEILVLPQTGYVDAGLDQALEQRRRRIPPPGRPEPPGPDRTTVLLI